MERADREVLFDRARELSTRQQTWSDADALWKKVIDAYRAAVSGARTPQRRDQRQLARALWRRSMLLSMMGRAADGLAPGEQAVALFEQLHDVAAKEGGDVTAPRRDEALAELITAMVDLGEVEFAAGDTQARVARIDRALGVGLRVVSPPAAGRRTREAMATGYHNYATALLHRRSERDGDLREAALAGSRAAQLRQEMLDPARPISMWELGNTYAVYALCLASIGDLSRAHAVLDLGDRLVDVMGPAGADIATKLQAAREMVNGVPPRQWWRGRR
jgi:hypothetical protein